MAGASGCHSLILDAVSLLDGAIGEIINSFMYIANVGVPEGINYLLPHMYNGLGAHARVYPGMTLSLKVTEASEGSWGCHAHCYVTFNKTPMLLLLNCPLPAFRR